MYKKPSFGLGWHGKRTDHHTACNSPATVVRRTELKNNDFVTKPELYLSTDSSGALFIKVDIGAKKKSISSGVFENNRLVIIWVEKSLESASSPVTLTRC